MACQRLEYVFGLTTHSPAEFFVLVTFGSYSQVWMLRPPIALLVTETLLVKYWLKCAPQPTGQPEAAAMVESPASHTLTGPGGWVVGGGLVGGQGVTVGAIST